ncbi:MAG TPA: ATP-binding protein, partial [Tepidisphaeraceae bacterium]|nr:ATP-binding protein [Tepidisphaeraceae bacterium]
VQAELTSAKEAAEQARSTAEDLRRQAEAANRSKDHFLSVLSHELRTPLTPALAAIGLLEKDATLPENTREQIGMIRRNVETEARLMDDLLDLTRIARGKMALHPEVIDTHAVIRNVVAMFQKEIDEKSLAVRLALRARDRHVWADAGRFQQVMLNLMSNAVKFTPNDGEITFSSSNEGDTLQIDVADTGIGIEADVVPRLFSAFEQGEKSFARRFGGLGLGLSIVKSLVAMHNGTVTVFSAGKGRGATFTIRLPVTRAHGEHSSSCGAAAVAMLPKNFRALLVEDHDDTRQVMGLLLRNFGCTVTSAASVKEATQLADRNHFDLLVCDFGLPDGTGADVIRHLHRQYQIKGIAITGFGQDEDLRRSKEAGFSVHLTKPINIDALHQAIREVATE